MSSGRINFETVIRDDSIKKIYSFSDIHADMDTLLICLRDCAKVIVKKEGFGYVPGSYDEDANALCSMDISDVDGDYKDDLNYDWNPEATNVCVVIIGDILDGTRTSSYKEGMYPFNFKPQIEIKIYRFINSLMIKAAERGSRLIKLLGNHEIINFSGNASNIENYSFIEDKLARNYYRTFNRNSVFKKGNPGFNLIMENGNGIIVIINGNVFVHGQLAETYDLRNYVAINNFLNTLDETMINPKTGREFNFDELIGPGMPNSSSRVDVGQLNDDKFSPLWLRIFGDPDISKHRLARGDITVCDTIKRLFSSLFPPGSDIDIDKLRLIIGHCPQYTTAFNFTLNQSFNTFTPSEDGLVEYYTPPAIIGQPSTERNLLFGITMECPKNDAKSDFFIFRVDVGDSRGFDQMGEIDIVRDNDGCRSYINSDNMGECRRTNGRIYAEKMLFGSRVPQVLEFSGDKLELVRIIKSTIKNTRINQPRNIYEEKIKDFPELKLDSGHYRNKYLKYKNKYLLLKNKLKK